MTATSVSTAPPTNGMESKGGALAAVPSLQPRIHETPPAPSTTTLQTKTDATPQPSSASDVSPKAPSRAPSNPPPAQPAPGHKPSLSADTTDTTEPPFSPNSTTSVLEKDQELDFAGNVDVNDDVPSETDLERVGDLLLLDSEGESRPFKELYTGPGVAPRQLIIFVRHFFCGNCQEYLRTLSSSVTPEALLALPTPTFITVIGCGRPELIGMYVQATSCAFPVYAEPTRKLYDQLGMTRTWDLGKKPEYIHSNLFVTSVQSVMQSLKTGNRALKGGDFKQVGGEFLFDEGKCVWAHRMRNTRDHTEVDALRGLLGLDVQKPPLRKRWSHGIKEIREGRSRASSWGKVRTSSKKPRDKAGNGTATAREDEGVKVNEGKTI